MLLASQYIHSFCILWSEMALRAQFSNTIRTGQGSEALRYKIISLNTNGIRAAVQKQLQRFIL